MNAILSGMQFRENDSNLSSFNIVTGDKSSTSNIADLIESYMPISTHVKTKPHIDLVHDAKGEYFPPMVSLKSNRYLRWVPRTFLRDGVKKMLGFYLDEHLPFGPSPKIVGEEKVLSAIETGQAFHLREGDSLCPLDDLNCRRGRRIFPCSSECSDPSSCTASPFDKIVEVSRKLTTNCQIVLYMDNMNEDVSDFTASAPQQDDSTPAICSIAFILKSSHLAKSMVDEGDENGVFSYHGWKVIAIDSFEDDISTELDYLLKMTPGKMQNLILVVLQLVGTGLETNLPVT